MDANIITVGTVVMFMDQYNHRDAPSFYPEVGTLGTVLEYNDGAEEYLIQWAHGTTDGDGQWYCKREDILTLEELDAMIEKARLSSCENGR